MNTNKQTNKHVEWAWRSLWMSPNWNGYCSFVGSYFNYIKVGVYKCTYWLDCMFEHQSSYVWMYLSYIGVWLIHRSNLTSEHCTNHIIHWSSDVWTIPLMYEWYIHTSKSFDVWLPRYAPMVGKVGFFRHYWFIL